MGPPKGLEPPRSGGSGRPRSDPALAIKKAVNSCD